MRLLWILSLIVGLSRSVPITEEYVSLNQDVFTMTLAAYAYQSPYEVYDDMYAVFQPQADISTLLWAASITPSDANACKFMQNFRKYQSCQPKIINNVTVTELIFPNSNQQTMFTVITDSLADRLNVWFVNRRENCNVLATDVIPSTGFLKPTRYKLRIQCVKNMTNRDNWYLPADFTSTLNLLLLQENSLKRFRSTPYIFENLTQMRQGDGAVLYLATYYQK
jgi:hypothetical protein